MAPSSFGNAAVVPTHARVSAPLAFCCGHFSRWKHVQNSLGFGFRAWLCSCVLLLAGCSQQLFGNLDEKSANLVVAALRSEGISAVKSTATEGFWKVTVPDEEFARASQILNRRNLPPQQFEGLGRVFKKESLVSTPTEERMRSIYAMSQELENSLSSLDGVLTARVHPVIPPHDPLNPKKVASSASVLIRYRPAAKIAGSESIIRTLVASGIEGLAVDNVSVLMVEAEPMPDVIDKVSMSRAVPPIFWGILGLLLGLLLITYFVLNWRDKTTEGLNSLRSRVIKKGRGQKKVEADRLPKEDQ
jgi:type III secretion protein J